MKTVHKFYLFVAFVLIVFVWHSLKVRQLRQNFQTNMSENRNLLNDKNSEIDRLSKRIETIDSFLSQVNILEVMDKNKSQDKVISNLNSQQKLYEQEIKRLRSELETVQSSQSEQTVDNWQQREEGLRQAYTAQLNTVEEKLNQAVDRLNQYQSQGITMYKQVYRTGDADFSALVARLKFLRTFVRSHQGQMDFKKQEYAQVFKALKRVLPEDPYIRSLRKLKIYKDEPVLASLKNKYTTFKDDSPLDYVGQSNRDLYEQLQAVIAHLDENYLKS